MIYPDIFNVPKVMKFCFLLFTVYISTRRAINAKDQGVKVERENDFSICSLLFGRENVGTPFGRQATIVVQYPHTIS